jgi:hypothetical protein
MATTVTQKMCPVCGSSRWGIQATYHGEPIKREFMPVWDVVSFTCLDCSYGESMFDDSADDPDAWENW